MVTLARLGAAKGKARKLRQLAAASGVAPTDDSARTSGDHRKSSIGRRGSWVRLSSDTFKLEDSEIGSEQLGYDHTPEATELAEALAVVCCERKLLIRHV